MFIRALSMFGLGAGFLVISPPLRATAMDILETVGNYLDGHAPLSYCEVALMILLTAMCWVHRVSQTR